MAAPTFRAKGAYATGTTSFLAAVPAGHASGDALYIVMESTDSTTAAGTPNTPSGWTKLFERTQLPGAAGVTTLTIFGIIDTGSITDVTVDGVLNHCSGSMVAIQGHTMGAITDTIVGTGNGADTGATITALGITTLVNNTLILFCVGNGRDGISSTRFASWTNANLSTLNEREDNITNTGTGGGIGYAEAVLATAGATGDSTTTEIAGADPWQAVHLGIPGDTAAVVGPPFRSRSAHGRMFDPWGTW